MVIGCTNFNKIITIPLPSLILQGSLGELVAKFIKFFLRARIAMVDSTSLLVSHLLVSEAPGTRFQVLTISLFSFPNLHPYQVIIFPAFAFFEGVGKSRNRAKYSHKI